MYICSHLCVLIFDRCDNLMFHFSLCSTFAKKVEHEMEQVKPSVYKGLSSNVPLFHFFLTIGLYNRELNVIENG